MLPAMCAFAVLASAGQGPIAVTVASRRAGADAVASKISNKVHDVLRARITLPLLDDGAATKQLKKAGADPRACQGAPDCLRKLAAKLGPGAVLVGVDVGKIGKSLAVHLEAVGATGETSLAVSDFSADADAWNEQSQGPIRAFAEQLAATFAPASSAAPLSAELKTPTDAPQGGATLTPSPALSPEPDPVRTSIATTSRPRSSNALPVAILTGAGVSLVGSLLTFALGMIDKGTVDRANNGDGTSSLTEAQFNTLRNRGNLYFTLSLVTLLSGVVLGAAGGITLAIL